MEPSTLRDQFAMAALVGLLSCPDTTLGARASYAEASYAYADAMLKAREQKEVNHG